MVFTYNVFIEKAEHGFTNHLVYIPLEAANYFLENKIKRVSGQFNELPFRLALHSNSNGQLYLMMSKSTLKSLKAVEGQKIEMILMADPKPNELNEPEELVEVLAQEPEAFIAYQKLTIGVKRSLVFYISQAKTIDTRIKRALQMAEKMKNGTLFRPTEKGKK